jgi:hypothetical protein
MDIKDLFDKIRNPAFPLASLFDGMDEKSYRHSRTPQERFQALELMRQRVYSYDPATMRIQKVLEVVRYTPPLSKE